MTKACTCATCANRLETGLWQRDKCRITGLPIDNPQDSCLAYAIKKCSSGADTPGDEQNRTPR